jgi:hypothetical protein
MLLSPGSRRLPATLPAGVTTRVEPENDEADDFMCDKEISPSNFSLSLPVSEKIFTFLRGRSISGRLIQTGNLIVPRVDSFVGISRDRRTMKTARGSG